MNITTVALAPPLIFQVDQVQNISFWRDQFPELAITEAGGKKMAPHLTGNLSDARNAMLKEGYFQGNSETLTRLAPRLAQAIEHCFHNNIPTIFLFLFDEAWECFFSLNPLLRHLLNGPYAMLPDFWVWYVDHTSESAGWTPHRDKGGYSLASDGSPLSLTVWIPLTETTPLNGCIYLLPAHLDRTYNTLQEKTWDFDLPNVRALPVKPGEFLCWNQAVLHWGARSSKRAEAARMSMAFEFQRSSVPPFNTPLLTACNIPDFNTRLKLIAKQMLQYQHMYALEPALKAVAERLCEAQ